MSGPRGGSGEPDARLDGGPGLSDYTEGLEDELADICELVRYTQRGVEPSATSGPFTVEQHVDDAVAMLDAAGWDRAWVLGHSWGGHLAMHLATSHPDRLVGVISMSALGSAGDGGAADFEAENVSRARPPKTAIVPRSSTSGQWREWEPRRTRSSRCGWFGVPTSRIPRMPRRCRRCVYRCRVTPRRSSR